MELLTTVLADYGITGVVVGGGVALFRWLLAEARELAADNIADLRAARDDWRERALTAEATVALYRSAYGPPPGIDYRRVVEDHLAPRR